MFACLCWSSGNYLYSFFGQIVGTTIRIWPKTADPIFGTALLQMLDGSEDDKARGAEISVPPATNTGNDTNWDSGDKMLCSRDPNNLNHNQLLADACIKKSLAEMSELVLK